MYDRITRALETSNLSNYLYRFKENEMDDEIVELCLQDSTLIDELRNIMPVGAHLIKFISEFKKTQHQPQPFSYIHGSSPKQKSFVKPSENYSHPPIPRATIVKQSTEDDGSPRSGSSSKSKRGDVQRPSEKKKDIRTELQEIFDAVDTDKSGRISVDELYKATTKSNDSRLSLDACRLMISMFDDDRRGSIDVMGFFSLILLVHDWQAAFEKFDSDKSGYLDRRELIVPLQEIAKGYLFDQNFVDMIVGRFGTDKGLDSDGFVNACAFISTFTRGFRQKDRARQGIITYQDFLSVVLNAWN